MGLHSWSRSKRREPQPCASQFISIFFLLFLPLLHRQSCKFLGWVPCAVSLTVSPRSIGQFHTRRRRNAGRSRCRQSRGRLQCSTAQPIQLAASKHVLNHRASARSAQAKTVCTSTFSGRLVRRRHLLCPCLSGCTAEIFGMASPVVSSVRACMLSLAFSSWMRAPQPTQPFF